MAIPFLSSSDALMIAPNLLAGTLLFHLCLVRDGVVFVSTSPSPKISQSVRLDSLNKKCLPAASDNIVDCY